MLTICRFCLHDDEKSLYLLAESVDSDVTIEDVEMLTGIQLNAEELDSYSVCFECSKQLKRSTAFRYLCLSNDTHFRQLCRMRFDKIVLESLEIEFLSSGTDEDDSIDDTPSVVQKPLTPTDELNIQIERYDRCSTNGILSDQSPNHGHGFSDGEQDEDPQQYSNYSAYTLASKSEPEPPIVPNHYKNTTRRRNSNAQRQLCSMCGKMVTNIMLHISSHKKETNYKCPHCPTKMTHPANLKRHIKAVHLKTILKTCDLCGKGFTHKNTYKSHMVRWL
uniref:Uncharacterized protein n=1 Tax=Anopheles maculatus TaxID=74869 RepID=A0A182TAN2_9DIPT